MGFDYEGIVPSGLFPIGGSIGGVPIATIPTGRFAGLNPSKDEVGNLATGGFLCSTIALMSSTSSVSYFNKASVIQTINNNTFRIFPCDKTNLLVNLVPSCGL